MKRDDLTNHRRVRRPACPIQCYMGLGAMRDDNHPRAWAGTSYAPYPELLTIRLAAIDPGRFNYELESK